MISIKEFLRNKLKFFEGFEVKEFSAIDVLILNNTQLKNCVRLSAILRGPKVKQILASVKFNPCKMQEENNWLNVKMVQNRGRKCH